jgi:DNA-binding GntR family transcriptional regulator
MTLTHKTVSLADQVFERLESDILSGVYKRGEILTELKLCEALGVSRTPVREAMKRLEQEHIIEDCGKGMRVLSITAEDAACIYEIRSRVEGLAAAACAKNISAEDLKALRDIVDLQAFYAERGDSDRVKTLDSEFHEMIYRCSGSAVLFDTLSPLHKKVQKFRKAAVEQRSRAEESVKEHRALYEAIASRDEGEAERVMNAHVASARDRLAKSLSKAETGEESK